jgi:esterase/lipase superfamily enzyme
VPKFVLAGFLLLLVPYPSLVTAATTVLAVDVSASMGEACAGSQETPLQAVRKAVADYLQSRAESDRHSQVGMIIFGRQSMVVSEPASDPLRILALAEQIEIQGGNSSLADGIGLARSLLPPEGGNVIVYTRSPPEVGLLRALTHESGGALQTEVNLVSGSSSAGQTSGSLLVRTLSCGTETAATDTGNQVRQLIAEALGVPIDLVTPAADLVADLGADHSLAFQTLSLVCGKLRIPMPPESDLTKVGAIIAYAEYASSGDLADREPALRRGFLGWGEPEPPKPVVVQTLFYATDREATGSSDPYRFFGANRKEGDALHYGRCEVSIPVLDHRKGRVEAPLFGLEFLRSPEKHIILKSVEPMERDTFFQEIREALRPDAIEAEWGDDVLLFVHGYNVSFNQAARRTAQIAYDMGFDGVPMMFSWPSNARLTAYFADRENIEWSVTHIEQFLDELLQQARPGRLHLIAHSMGNEGLLRALGFLARRYDGQNVPPLFENVILAAPDFDTRIFIEQYAPRIQHLARRWTVYASDKDQALNLSASLRSARRLGIPTAVADGIDTVDATGVEVTPWSVPEFHSYYATKKRVMQDLVSVLRGMAPRRRGLSQAEQDGKIYWSLNLPDNP